MAEHASGHPGHFVEDVPVLPDPLAAMLRQEAHPAAVHSIGADPLEVGVELVLRGGRQESPEVPADAVLGPEAQGLCRSGVHEEQVALEVVNAHEPQAVLDEGAKEVALLAGYSSVVVHHSLA